MQDVHDIWKAAEVQIEVNKISSFHVISQRKLAQMLWNTSTLPHKLPAASASSGSPPANKVSTLTGYVFLGVTYVFLEEPINTWVLGKGLVLILISVLHDRNPT